METAVRRIASVKVVRTQMGQEWCSVLLHLEGEITVNYNVWTFHAVRGLLLITKRRCRLASGRARNLCTGIGTKTSNKHTKSVASI